MSTWTIKNPTAPASEAQINFYATLVVEHQAALGQQAPASEIKAAIVAWCDGKTKKELSDLITQRKAAIAELPKAKTAVEPGYYAKDGQFFFVTESKSSGKPYAKIWTVKPGNVKATWVYAPGAVKGLVGLAPMTLTDAKEFGHAHGYCIRCGATLTDPKSVEAGIGPICAGYWA